MWKKLGHYVKYQKQQNAMACCNLTVIKYSTQMRQLMFNLIIIVLFIFYIDTLTLS